jgi:hypothetical protein
MKLSTTWCIFLGVWIVTWAAACSNAAAFVGETPTSQSTPPAAIDFPHLVDESPSPVPARQVSTTATQQHLKTAPPDIFTAPTSTPAKPTACPPNLCIYAGQFQIERPISPPGRDTVDGSYRFGSTQAGKRDLHHGVEFLNSLGTQVLAAADGLVVVAGDDRKMLYGPYYNFYGNLVVLEHQLVGVSETVYTLYAHLSEVLVEEGQRVQAGEQIGLVGMSGVATGSHLHFEVRLGENNYRAVRNPELWLKPPMDEDGTMQGTLAGQIIAPPSINLKIPNIVVERLSGPQGEVISQIYISTYDERTLKGLPPWEESFAIGELSPGWYQVSFVQYGIQQNKFQILPGELTVVRFDFSDKN